MIWRWQRRNINEIHPARVPSFFAAFAWFNVGRSVRRSVHSSDGCVVTLVGGGGFLCPWRHFTFLPQPSDQYVFRITDPAIIGIKLCFIRTNTFTFTHVILSSKLIRRPWLLLPVTTTPTQLLTQTLNRVVSIPIISRELVVAGLHRILP